MSDPYCLEGTVKWQERGSAGVIGHDFGSWLHAGRKFFFLQEPGSLNSKNFFFSGLTGILTKSLSSDVFFNRRKCRGITGLCHFTVSLLEHFLQLKFKKLGQTLKNFGQLVAPVHKNTNVELILIVCDCWDPIDLIFIEKEPHSQPE